MKIDYTQAWPVDAENDLPYKLAGQDKCEWLRVDGQRFTEPFFDQTITRCAIVQPPELKHRTTRIDEMLKMARQLPQVKPAVVIFHISRCGSTLAAQAFTTSNRFVLLSEVPFFDDIMRWPLHDADFGRRCNTDTLFEAALRFYGRKRRPSEESVIIKTDCWHIFFYDVFRRLFPDVPFILMYRNPAEVLRSLLGIPALHTVPDLVQPELFGLPGVPEVYQPDVYTASVIEKLLEKFLSVASTDNYSLLINYNEGPMPIVKKIAAFAHLEIVADELAAMEKRSHYHSKRPHDVFTEPLITGIPTCIVPAMELYNQLNAMKQA